MKEVTDLLVIGGGAAGLACAVTAARLGLKVLVLERTERCGKKLAITGGGKGNFTHAESARAMADRFDCGARVIMPLLRDFPYQRIERFFSGLGIRARRDDEGCVWPEGTDATGLRDALLREAAAQGVVVRTGCRVAHLRLGVGSRQHTAYREEVAARAICLATGGASHPRSGSTGDGLLLGRGLGLQTVDWFPALASLRTELDLSSLAGVTQPKVRMSLILEGEPTRAATGHFIFAHSYVSGSSVLNLCGHAARALARQRRVVLRVDWVPDFGQAELTSQFAIARQEHPKQQLGTFLGSLVARCLALRLCELARVRADRLLTHLSRSEQEAMVRQLRATNLAITGAEPLERATVTGGGISLEEVNLKTLESRRLPGLYFAGEVLDLWAETGGYNLHFAWTSGIRAAESVALESKTGVLSHRLPSSAGLERSGSS